MSYLLTLHHRADLTVATTEPVVPPEQLVPLQDALALADALSTLLAGQQAALAQAEAEVCAAGDALRLDDLRQCAYALGRNVSCRRHY